MVHKLLEQARALLDAWDECGDEWDEADVGRRMASFLRNIIVEEPSPPSNDNVTTLSKIELPELQAGEHYAGIVVTNAGHPDYHLILLPGDNSPGEHSTQCEWARSLGGELPSAAELTLLQANCEHLFVHDWYWSSDANNTHARWGSFGSNENCQGFAWLSCRLRARAIRRVPVEIL